MKQLKKFTSVLLALLVITSSIIISTVAVNAKSFKTTVLKKNKTYSFNLDKKGKSEKIRFEQTEEEKEYTTYYKSELYINGKKVFSSNDTDNVKVVVADTDKSDKQLEVFIIKGGLIPINQGWSFINHIYYYKYSKGKAKKVQDLYNLAKSKFSKFAYLHAPTNNYIKVDGKGELTTKVCVKLASYNKNNGLDFIHFNNLVKLVKGKFVNTKSKSYKALDEKIGSEIYWRVSNGKNKVYKNPDTKKVAYTLKNNSKFTILSLYRKSKNKVFLQIKNKNGQKGYINPKTFKATQTGTHHVGG